MPRRREENAKSMDVRQPEVERLRSDLIDQLLRQYGGSAGVTGPEGLLKDLTRAVGNRAMEAELTHHLGYGPGEAPLQSIRIGATARRRRPCARATVRSKSRCPETARAASSRS
jgi:hypothetical protein